jgi:hypothetical protein
MILASFSAWSAPLFYPVIWLLFPLGMNRAGAAGDFSERRFSEIRQFNPIRVWRNWRIGRIYIVRASQIAVAGPASAMPAIPSQ